MLVNVVWWQLLRSGGCSDLGGFENLRGLGERRTVPGNKLPERRFVASLAARNKTYETARMPTAYTLQVSAREKK